jgi:hypothetical protein
MAERRTELRREPWRGSAKAISDRPFVNCLIDKHQAEDIIDLEDGTCTWA